MDPGSYFKRFANAGFQASSHLYITDFLFVFSYYCNGSTIDPNPTEGLCPVGNYCPEGSYQPTACPDGTIAVSTGNDNLTDCELCKPGNYCTPASSKNGKFTI